MNIKGGNIKFAETLKRLRLTKGFSRQGLVNKLHEKGVTGNSRTIIEYMEKNKASNISRERIDAISKALELNEIDEHELLNAAGYSAGYGISQELASQDQSEAVESVWIIARILLDDSTIFYNTVLENVINGVIYRYFIPRREKNHFILFCQKIYTDLKEEMQSEKAALKTLLMSIIGIVSPDTMFFSSFAIYDPNLIESRRGRESIIKDGATIEIKTIDKIQTNQIFETLSSIIAELKVAEIKNQFEINSGRGQFTTINIKEEISL